MDFYKVPMGFGMALSMNPFALNVYSSMTEEEKVAILNRAHNAKSEKRCTLSWTLLQKVMYKNAGRELDPVLFTFITAIDKL